MALQKEVGTLGQDELTSFTSHTFDPAKDALLLMGHSLAQVGRRNFRERTIAGKSLMAELRNPQNAVVFLGDPKRHLIGYIYAACDI